MMHLRLFAALVVAAGPLQFDFTGSSKAAPASSQPVSQKLGPCDWHAREFFVCCLAWLTRESLENVAVLVGLAGTMWAGCGLFVGVNGLASFDILSKIKSLSERKLLGIQRNDA
jgi:hypothetical protein